jgi:uncharacterized OsmC-like protein
MEADLVFTMPDLFKIKVAGQSESATKTVLHARHHTVVVDEPASRAGTDLAPSPLETFLSSFLACTNVIAHMAAEDMGIELTSMELALVAELDTRGAFAKADLRRPFPRISLDVVIETGAGADQIEALRQAVSQRCPIAVILREAGVELNDSWRLKS